MPASGGTPEPLTQERQGGPLAWPQFLPDGRRFVFTTFRARSSTLVSDGDTGEARLIAEGRGPSRFASDLLLLSRGTTLEAQAHVGRFGQGEKAEVSF